MKLKGFMMSVAMIGAMMFVGTAKVDALEQNEVEVLEENKTELAEWFDEDLKTIILGVGTTMSGVVISMGLFLKSLKSLTSYFKKNAEENEISSKTIKNCEKEIKESNSVTKSAIEANNKETVEKIAADNERTRQEIEKLTKVFGIAFSNDSKLVKNGAANEIMKVLGGNNENTEA